MMKSNSFKIILLFMIIFYAVFVYASEITINEITGYQIKDNYLLGVLPNTLANDIDLGLDLEYSLKIKGDNNNYKSNDLIVTKDKMEIYLENNKICEYFIVIDADINGDGKIGALDYIAIRNHMMEVNKIVDEVFIKAADCNNDNKISVLDYIMIRKYMLNKSDEYFQILYDSNGGSGTMSDDNVFQHQLFNLKRNRYTKEGYRFLNWNSKSDGSGKEYYENERIVVDNNITLYAIWEKCDLDDIYIELFDNDNLDNILIKENISGVIYPNYQSVENDIEILDNISHNAGLLADFTSSGQNSWVQRFFIETDLLNNINENYNLRFWYVQDDNTNASVSLLIKYKNGNVIYLDANDARKYDYLKNEMNVEIINVSSSTNGVKIDKGFKGWISYPLNNISLSDIEAIGFDIRTFVEKIDSQEIGDRTPRSNTYYIIDNITLSSNLYGNSSKTNFEMQYRSDMVGIYYTVFHDALIDTNRIQNDNGDYGYIFYNNTAIDNNTCKNEWVMENNLVVYEQCIRDSNTNGKHFFWGKPALGYYKSDKNIMKKHMEQLTNADTDFIVIDFTNQPDSLSFVENNMNNGYSKEEAEFLYNAVWKAQVTDPLNILFDTLLSLKEEGKKVPAVVLWIGSFVNFNDMMNGKITSEYSSVDAIYHFYKEYYSNHKYDSLWAYYDNKPFIITTTQINDNTFEKTLNVCPSYITSTSDCTTLYDEIKDYYSYRNMWALQKGESSIENGEWTNRVPYNGIYGKDNEGNMEEMSVNVAISWYYMSNPSSSFGRMGGITFYQQWKNIYNYHPKITIVSNWNEWIATNYYDDTGSKGCTNNTCFTDEYNQEYSNDIEPMDQGHADQYYKWYQDYVKNYKKHNDLPANFDINQILEGNENTIPSKVDIQTIKNQCSSSKDVACANYIWNLMLGAYYNVCSECDQVYVN